MQTEQTETTDGVVQSRDERIEVLAELIANIEGASDMVRRIRSATLDLAAECAIPTEDMIEEASELNPSLIYDMAIFFRKFDDEIEDYRKVVKARLDKALRIALDIMGEEGTKQIVRHGRMLFLSEEHTVEPRISDLLPEGVDPKDRKYETTVAGCRAHARNRLISALQESELSDLVETKYDTRSLRSRLVGTKADKDDNGDPIIPECVRDLVDIGSFYRAKIKKHGK